MFFEIIIFFSYFVFCLFSIIGYGIIFKKLLFCTNDQNLGELGFFGFFFLFFISLFFHFFIPLSYWFNLIVLLIGLCIFIINFSIIKNEIILIRKSFFLFSIIILPALFFIKIPADFETYHLPYVNYLNNFKIIFGLVNLSNNYAYGHGWLDILGFFSVPIIENRGISLIALLFLYFFFLYLITEIKQTKLKSVKIYSILAIVYSFANFNKVENLAAEVQPTLLILILILHILKFLNNTSVNETFMKIIFYSFYALILRIGSLIILPIVLVIIIININKIIKICFNYLKLNFFILVFLLILLSKNFILTGCFVYPLYWTCPDNNITWANPIENVKKRFEFISAISKRWKFYILEEANLNNELEYYEPMEKNIILSPKLYNHNKFFWLKYWSKDHDVKRLLNAFLIVLFCYLSFFIFAKNKFIILSSLIVRPKKNNLIHLGIILSILMWFFLSPQMRYGGYGIIGGGLIFFSSLILSKYIIPNKQFIAVSIFLFFISSSFFLSKNIPRITKNVFINDKSNISLWPLYKNKTIGKDYKKVIKNGVKLNLILTPKNIIKDPVQCGNLKMLCLPEERIVCISNIDINKGYYFISNKNNKCLLQFKKNYWQH